MEFDEERYCIVNAADLTWAILSEEIEEENASLSRMAADQVLAKQLEIDPSRAGTLMVIPEYEAVETAA